MGRVWYETGVFFADSDVDKTSLTAFEYTNLARKKGHSLVQADMSSDVHNPHPDYHLKSGVMTDGTHVYRRGAPPYMLLSFDDSVLPNPLSVIPQAQRKSKIEVDFYIPSSWQELISTETTSYRQTECVFYTPVWRIVVNNNRIMPVFYFGASTDYGCPVLTSLSTWYTLFMEWDPDSGLTYGIKDVYSKTRNFNALQTFFSDPVSIDVSAYYTNYVPQYRTENGLKIANLRLSIQDEQEIQPPAVSIVQDWNVGQITLRATATPDPEIADPTLTYLWASGETSDTLAVHSNGTYSVTVTDSQGNQTQKSVTITDFYELPAPLQASYSFSSEPAIVRTSMYDGRARQRIMSGGEKHKSLNCQFLMNEDSLDLWQQNWRETLKEGSEWFWLKTLGNDDFVEYHNVRLNKGEWKAKLAYSSDSETVYTVSMDLEVR